MEIGAHRIARVGVVGMRKLLVGASRQRPRLEAQDFVQPPVGEGDSALRIDAGDADRGLIECRLEAQLAFPEIGFRPPLSFACPHGLHPVRDVARQFAEQLEFAGVQGGGLAGKYSEHPQRLAVANEGKSGEHLETARKRLVAPCGESRVDADIPHRLRLAGADRHARGPAPELVVRPGELDRSEIIIAVARACHGLYGAAFVVPHQPDPRHPVAAGVDDDAAHVLKKLPLLGSAHQHVAALGDDLVCPRRGARMLTVRRRAEDRLIHDITLYACLRPDQSGNV